jgi:hypothetical protein
MAIGFGPGSDMVRTTNKQRSSRKKRSLKESSDQTAIGNDNEVGLKYKESSPAQLEQIRDKMKVKNRKNLQVAIVLVALIVVAAVFGAIYL